MNWGTEKTKRLVTCPCGLSFTATCGPNRKYCDNCKRSRRRAQNEVSATRTRERKREADRRYYEKTKQACKGACGALVGKRGSGYCRRCSPHFNRAGHDWDVSTI